MNALMNWMEQHLVPIANRFAQNPILKTMSEGAMSLLAVIMVGSIFSILNGACKRMQIDAYVSPCIKLKYKWIKDEKTRYIERDRIGSENTLNSLVQETNFCTEL